MPEDEKPEYDFSNVETFTPGPDYPAPDPDTRVFSVYIHHVDKGDAESNFLQFDTILEPILMHNARHSWIKHPEAFKHFRAMALDAVARSLDHLMKHVTRGEN